MIAESIRERQGHDRILSATGKSVAIIALEGSKTAVIPNPEVPDKAVRRRFRAEYKIRILNESDACTDSGSLGALLRREGLYASNLNTWRHQRERGILSGLTPKKRGRKESIRDPLVAENEKLRKENERLTNRLRQAEIIIDVQKKVSQILGIPLATPGEGGAD
jgi:transposase-like protein